MNKRRDDTASMTIGLKNSQMRVAYVIAFGFGAVFLAWTAFTVALANVVRVANPTVALQFAGGDPVAMAAKIDEDFSNATSPLVFERSLGTLTTSVRGQALNPRALRLMGFVAEANGDMPKARQLIDIAARMSRRDVGAQIWLIDDAVARGSALQALQHFDNVLRTTTEANTTLLPILIGATEERSLIAPLAKVLAQGPAWRFSFYSDLVAKGSSALNILSLYELVDKTPGAFNEDAVRGLIGRLANEKLFQQAAGVYQKATGQPRRIGFNNLTFDRDGNLTPFDWAYGETDGVRGLRTQIRSGNDQNQVLVYQLETKAAGEIARQLLVLPEGRYRVSAVHGSLRNERQGALRWQIQCAEGAGQIINADDGLTTQFAVPAANCRAQWAILRGTATSEPASGWIDNVMVEANK